jgi:hypothetical protein
MKQVKVKSYVRNGKTVRSYDRSIKDTVFDVGRVAGLGIGGAALLKYGKRIPLGWGDKFIFGGMAGAYLGSLPSKLIDKNNKKAKQQLKNVATIGGGLAGLGLATLGGIKGYKFIKARNTKSLVLFNPNESYRNTVATFNIKVKEQARTAPKTIGEMNQKFEKLYSKSDLFDASLKNSTFGMRYEILRTSKRFNLNDALKMYDENTTDIGKKLLIERERILAVEGVDSFRDTIYKAVTKDLDAPLSKAERKYFAGVAKMNDPNVREAERKVLKQSLDSYAKANNIDKTRVSGSVDLNKIVKSLKERGFTELDIKQMMDKHNNIKL